MHASSKKLHRSFESSQYHVSTEIFSTWSSLGSLIRLVFRKHPEFCP